jgi:hypothetical protein
MIFRVLHKRSSCHEIVFYAALASAKIEFVTQTLVDTPENV